MQDISVGIYSIRLYDSKMNEYIEIRRNSYSIDLVGVIKGYFNNMLKKGRVDKKGKSLFIVEDIIENKAMKLSGTIKTGNYGYESEMYDTKNNLNLKNSQEENIIVENLKKIYTKPKEYAEVLPFIFDFNLKDNGNKKLYLALQRFGQYGIKTLLEKELNLFLREHYSEYKNLFIKIHDLVSEKIIREYYQKEGIRAITLKRYRVPEDIADILRNNGALPEDYKVEYTIKPIKRNGKIPFLKNIFNFFCSEKKNIKNIIEITKNKELMYDDISAELIVDGKIKKVDFSNFQKFKVYEIVEVDRENNGHPNKKQLLEKMDDLLKETISRIENV